ncbi:MAG: glycosyltransferase family protein [Rhodospirillales bacterium]|nr:glycosyltransferase family protein [Rhodospirillales bacterium]
MPDSKKLEDAKKLIGQGRLEEASAICHRMINENADDEAVYLLAVISGQSGMYAESLNLFEKAIKNQPDRWDITYNYGVILNTMGKSDEAIQWWIKTLDLNPDHSDSLYNLGRAYADKHRWAEALETFERLHVLEPGNTRVLQNLGKLHFRMLEWDRARSFFEEVLSTNPNNVEALTNLGLTEFRTGNPKSAMENFNHALELDPENILAHVNLAQTLLLTGNLSQGYAEYEWRRKIQTLRFPVSGQTPWDGQNPAGKRILLYGEQGQGDVIHFLRYASCVADRGGLVSVCCHPSLTAIAKSVQGVENAIEFDETPVDFDVFAPLMSLPHLLQMTELQDIPSQPYIAAPIPLDLAGKKGFLRVGLVWAGNRTHDDDARRSLSLDQLAPLLEVENVEFFSLQVENAADEIDATEFAGNISGIGAGFSNFDDTAAALQALDLLISVDTATAHLGGALGKPVWLMLPSVPDWRWFREGENTPWYPSMRLFRQTDTATWGPVILKIQETLKELTK